MVWDRGRTRKRTIPIHTARNRFHYKRVAATLIITGTPAEGDQTQNTPPTVISARVVLNDINSKGLLLFASSPVAHEQRVEIHMQEPHTFSQTGIVRSCQQISYDQKILSDQQFQYRIAFEFDVSSDQDRDRIDAYCNVIQGTCIR